MNIGIGAMLGYLSGNESTVSAYNSAMGRTISAARIDEDVREDGALVLSFEDGGELLVFDEGRSCCESRYLTCDDDLSDLIGGKLTSIELREGGAAERDWDFHETQFVKVETDKGGVTLCTHNEHNGYYGGFCIRLAFKEAGQ